MLMNISKNERKNEKYCVPFYEMNICVNQTVKNCCWLLPKYAKSKVYFHNNTGGCHGELGRDEKCFMNVYIN